MSCRTRPDVRALGPIYYSLDWGGVHIVFYLNEDHFLDAPTRVRKLQWFLRDLAMQPAGLLIADDRLYVAVAAGRIECRDMDDGALRWQYGVGDALLDLIPYQGRGPSLLAAPVLFDGHLCLAANDGHLHILDRESGHCLVRYDFGSPLSAAPAVAPNALYIGTLDGRLLCYSL